MIKKSARRILSRYDLLKRVNGVAGAATLDLLQVDLNQIFVTRQFRDEPFQRAVRVSSLASARARGFDRRPERHEPFPGRTVRPHANMLFKCPKWNGSKVPPKMPTLFGFTEHPLSKCIDQGFDIFAGGRRNFHDLRAPVF